MPTFYYLNKTDTNNGLHNSLPGMFRSISSGAHTTELKWGMKLLSEMQNSHNLLTFYTLISSTEDSKGEI